MKRFKTYIQEVLGHKTWVKGTALVLTAQVRSLTGKIESEKDEAKRAVLLARQNNLLAYLTTLGIAVDMNDKSLISKVRRG